MAKDPDMIVIHGEAVELLRKKADELGVSLDDFVDFGYGLVCHLVSQGFILNDLSHKKASLVVRNPKTGKLVPVSWFWGGKTLVTN